METQSIQIDPTPLCIDLDGTLVKLDTLHQAVCLLVRRNPTALLSLPRWIRQGRAFTKNEVAKRIALHAEHLPYNTPLLDYLRAEKGWPANHSRNCRQLSNRRSRSQPYRSV